ncbi:hypothetical protein LEL_05410 [Akanthomyces lecanii RCEF 1005]|uniref:Ima1 N-terminal domain-containing protein n=1 Tax=Akanthomyces lecanii RCEF 1005 TaxID=1081108 RepID=A0A168I142_CORDF|nr:hypothetical protein LEL_05410 [Akanthomyces lecanii RCEF 1005]
MRRTGRAKHLSCFYCGKQTGLKYDGTITNFLCLSCDATNYLDENGDITDPPVATEREAAPSQYAKPQPAAAVEPDVVFCETCLKNQRLFTACLAQYLPDDPSDPDYEELDRNYYRYRRNLEKRYPQVCDECADKVQERIRQAGYTAKTDHLRRMMDKTRGRKATQRTSVLDVASSLGGWLWRGGLVAQLLWHLMHIIQALEHPDDGMRDPDDASIYAQALAATKTALTWLPDSDALIRISIMAAILSIWWNPHFVQFTRGFTRHLLGFTRWYSFQGLIIFLRIFFRSVLSMEGGAAPSQSAQLSIHLSTAGIMCFIYMMETRSIKVDTTPLFRPEDKPLTPRRTMTPAKRKKQDSKTFSELFNEALDSTPQKDGFSSGAATPGTPNYTSSSAFVPPSQLKTMQQQQQRGFNDSPLASAPAFKPLSQPTSADSGDEMDWSPSQPSTSQHRAFRNTDPAAPRPFGQSPTQQGDDGSGSSKNPFWFKVPAAPINPARQMRNPPNMPVLRKKPVEKDDVFFTSRRDSAEFKNRGGAGSSAGMAFKNPSFFAPENNDEANSLADLLGQSFSLSQEGQSHDKNAATASFPLSPSSFSLRHAPGAQQSPRRRPVELMTLSVLLPLWLLLSAFSSSIPYRLALQGVLLVAAGVIALSGTREMDDRRPPASQPKLVDAVLSALGVVELAGVCWVGWETWTGRVDVGGYGAGVLAVMLAHHTTGLFQA